MTNAEIDNLIAAKIMKWRHVHNDDMSATNDTVYMFYKDKTVLRGLAYSSIERWQPKDQKKWLKEHRGVQFDHTFDAWQPTSNVIHAMEVVYELRKRFSNFVLYADNGWAAEFWNIGPRGKHSTRLRGEASSPEMAICNAAFSVLGAGDKKARKKLQLDDNTTEFTCYEPRQKSGEKKVQRRGVRARRA